MSQAQTGERRFGRHSRISSRLLSRCSVLVGMIPLCRFRCFFTSSCVFIHCPLLHSFTRVCYCFVRAQHCCLVEALAWNAWGCMGLWGALYLGKEIYRGDPSAMICYDQEGTVVYPEDMDAEGITCEADEVVRGAFEQGLHVFSFAFSISCMVSLVASTRADACEWRVFGAVACAQRT